MGLSLLNSAIVDPLYSNIQFVSQEIVYQALVPRELLILSFESPTHNFQLLQLQLMIIDHIKMKVKKNCFQIIATIK